MAIKDHLTTTEEIVGDISCAHRVKYYVTDKRVIRYLQTATREEMDDLLCKHITSISLVSKARKRLIYGGLVLLATGLIALVVKFLDGLPAGWEPIFSYACYGFIALGLLLIICGFIFRVAYYRFIAAGITADLADRWTIIGVSPEAARRFIRLVRESA